MFSKEMLTQQVSKEEEQNTGVKIPHHNERQVWLKSYILKGVPLKNKSGQARLIQCFLILKQVPLVSGAFCFCLLKQSLVVKCGMCTDDKDIKCSKLGVMFTKWQRRNACQREKEHYFSFYSLIKDPSIWHHTEQTRVKL